ncbi:intersectin-1-like isoform X3 [Convolutriloba macropyga]|uniref:intersectin-1-like isoform X3 n=1 Tax=Convolutriloba macropyga TaxID=536237 RepID=UPI003F520769
MAANISFVPSRKGPNGLSVTSDEKQRYDRMFMALLPPGHQLVGGDKMKEVFLKSGLPPKVLGVIWEKSDLTKDGKLDQKEFAIAMCLIEHVMGGNNVPPVVPQHVINMQLVASSGSAAPGGPPPGAAHMQNSQSTNSFAGFGNSFIPGAPVAQQNSLPRPPMNAAPQLPPPPMPSGNMQFATAIPSHNSSVIDSAFGQPAFGAPPQIPARNDIGQAPNNAWFGGPPPQQVPPRRDSFPTVPPAGAFGGPQPAAAASQDWLVPVASRNKYRQQFMITEGGKSIGLIDSQEARNILVKTNVDKNVLAQVWNLSSLRKQANLNCDEFTLAMHLCDLFKSGQPLPGTLPPMLVPPSFRDPRLVGGQGVPTGGVNDAAISTAEQPPQKQPPPVSFEDKRRQNFDLGEQALERKRQALLEQQKREKEERMEKERQEEERRARERAEQERKRAEQIAEQQRRIDEARKEAEAKAQAEHDRRIAISLESRIASARSQLTQLRSQNSQMDSDIQVLASKKRSLDEQMEETRTSENSARQTLAERNNKYVERRKHLEKLQLQLQEFQRNLKQYSDKKMSIADQLKQQALRNPIAERHSQTMSSLEAEKRKVSNLKQQIMTAEKETAAKFHKIDLLNSQIAECKALLAKGAANTQNAAGGGAGNAADVATKKADLRRNSSCSFTWRPVDISNSHGGGGSFNRNRNSFRRVGASPAGLWLGTPSAVNAPTAPPAPTAPVDKYNAFADAFKNDPFATNSAFNTTYNGSSDPFKSEDPFGGGGAVAGKAADVSSGDPFASSANDPFMTGYSDPFAAATTNNQNSTSMFGGLPTTSATTTNSTAPVAPTAANSTPTVSKEPTEVLFEALYDFTTTDEGDLPFKVGDIIRASVEQNLDEPWLAGFLNGVGGWFPRNYTKRLDNASASSGAVLSNQQQSTSASVVPAVSGGSDPFGATSVASPSSAADFTDSSQSANSSNTGQTVLCRVRAIYPFEATAEGDLGLQAGVEVCVTNKEGDWWTGYLASDSKATKTQGIFPSNFVEEIPQQVTSPMATGGSLAPPSATSTPQTLSLPSGDGSQSGTGGGGSGKQQELASVIAAFQGDSPEQLTLQEGQVVVVKKKLPSGWWEGQIQGEKRKGWFPGDYVRVISSGLTPLPSANSSPERKSESERVRAQYAFTAEREDELSFSVGDVISIVSRDDADWWRGELNGRLGLFPANFVSPLGS